MSLFSALRIFSRVLPQALKEISGVLSAIVSIRAFTGEVSFAQHVQAGAESDDFDRDFLAEILVILRDVRRIVEREIHHRGFVGVYLQ